MAPEGIQKKLIRVQPPRVQISYELEVGDAMEVQELPFVLGTMSDLSGQAMEPLPRFDNRRFVNVSPDNFNSVLESVRPHWEPGVKNQPGEDSAGGDLKVGIKCRCMLDGEPEHAARQSIAREEVLERRGELSDVPGTLQTNDGLDQVLLAANFEPDKLDKLRSEVIAKDGAAVKEEEEGNAK